MKALYSNIMRLILTIGLSERDLFVDKVSKIISEKMDADPQRSEHIAESLLRMAESLKDELLLRQLFAQTRDAEPPAAYPQMAPHADGVGTRRQPNRAKGSRGNSPLTPFARLS